MIIDRSHQTWIARCAAVGVGCVAFYLLYELLRDPQGGRGGSALGLAFGFAGTGLIVFECLLSLRKRYPASPLGRVESWLKAHVWLGLLSFLLIVLHTGFHWGRGLGGALMWIFSLITASGLFGLIVQHYLPRRMTELVSRETVFEQIPRVVRMLRGEADERAEFITADLGVIEPEEEIVYAGGKKFYFDAAQRRSAGEKAEAERRRRKSAPQIVIDEESRLALRAHYLQEIRPFLEDRPGGFARRLFQNSNSLAAYFNHLRTIMPVPAHEVLKDLESICEERRQLRIQQRLHYWLHGWLLVHVPLSMAFLVLTFIHAAVSLRY